MTEPLEPEEAVRRLEQRLDRASATAERLIAEAATRKPPPAGWQAPHNGEQRADSELELLAQLIQSVRELVPTELERRLADALRELLLALRALLDFYIERLERRDAPPVEVEDIPIT